MEEPCSVQILNSYNSTDSSGYGPNLSIMGITKDSFTNNSTARIGSGRLACRNVEDIAVGASTDQAAITFPFGFSSLGSYLDTAINCCSVDRNWVGIVPCFDIPKQDQPGEILSCVSTCHLHFYYIPVAFCSGRRTHRPHPP